MLDFLLLIFLIVLMISLYGLLVAYRSRARGDRPTYYTAENTGVDGADGEVS